MPSRLMKYFVATRPWSFSMSFISVSVGTLVAASEHPVNWLWFLITIIGVMALHGAANILNDYFDTVQGVDEKDSPTVKYRPHPIFAGLMTAKAVLVEGLLLLVVAVIVGIGAAYSRTPHILWIGLLGVLTCLLYTAGPLQFKYHALGELAVFLMWGPLMVEGAYAVQAKAVALKPIFVSIPIGLLVALVLFANNIRDIGHDKRREIKTIAIVLGQERSLAIFMGLIILTYTSVVLMVLWGLASPWAFLTFLSLPKAVDLLKTLKKSIPDEADALTAKYNLVFGFLFMIAILLEKVHWL
ncbi:MAG TPA: 1,4-dihydroxy-2-naphthoate octaprenyltransferase [Syntrophales bacterium]|nr:1,4-dihydroxy-2-naphthoate octaprenyltransferase [Syntrophales bacterium]